ncbi:MAG: SDR family NAD(P)-dependent oxidoreductase, partial [Caldilineaceae bacterium]|nr:SDR family NAD(P)-dependent oxidoreductase [Caldilineaceae bacterium]
ELPEEMWDRIMDVNVKSRFLMTKYCVPEMRKRGGGVIINTASVQGLQSAYDVPAYAASKG